MALSSFEIAEQIKQISAEVEPEHQAVVRKHFTNLLLQSLAPQQYDVYKFLLQRQGERPGEWTTSGLVATQFGWKTNHAINILAALYEFKLVERQPVTDKSGLHYQWQAKPNTRYLEG